MSEFSLLIFRHIMYYFVEMKKNYEKNGEVMLNKEQFELLRTTVNVVTIAKKDIPEEPKKDIEENIFLDLGDFGKICLN